ncbi:hypothetical protein [Dyadobacter sp.]|uniref:hypothetical protein n=1 Tax=Dyadobacter sp. TaxID=1914288 RepID=UPI003264D3EC
MSNATVDFDAILAKCKCCACERLLQDSQYLNWAPLDIPANWEFPTWGNVLRGERGNAVAYVCDRCHESSQAGDAVKIIIAVQFTGDDIVYHRILEYGGFQE